MKASQEDDADIAVLAVRLKGNKVYYLNFEELRQLMMPEVMLNNYAVSDHWKLFVWDNHIQEHKRKSNDFIKKENRLSCAFIFTT